MPGNVKPIPDGYHGATPYLCVGDGAAALDFYKRAFNAVETLRMGAPGGKVGHAEMRIGEAVIMLADEHPDMNFRSPKSLGGSPVTIHLYVENVDALAAQAEAAGARILRPVADQFYGDRGGQLEDPFGHVWYLATHIEDVAPDELRRRADARFDVG